MNTASWDIPNQPALRTIQAVVESVLQTELVYTRWKRQPSSTRRYLDVLRDDLFRKADLLLAALRLERNFENLAIHESEEVARQWQECRQAMERLAEDYAAAFDAWGQAILTTHGDLKQ
jgi:hypothetical protein